MHLDLNDIQKLCQHYYPKRILRSPSEEPDLVWDFDPENKLLSAAIDTLKKRFECHVGARSDFNISEELVIEGQVRIHFSYIGPFAALNFAVLEGEQNATKAELITEIETILVDHKYTLISTNNLNDAVPWFVDGEVTVWECLFQPKQITATLEGRDTEKLFSFVEESVSESDEQSIQ